MIRILRRLAVIVAAAAGLFAAAPALAGCTLSPKVNTDYGTFSPQSVKQAAIPSLGGRAGLTCPSSTLVVLGGNTIKAKFQSANGMKLLNGANSVAYSASADSGATVAFTQGGTVDYMQNNLLNVLGLLNASNADLPIYLKPTGGTLPPIGTYTDKITITWNWYLCPGLNAALLCLSTPDTGVNQITTIDVTLTVGAKSVVLTTSTGTTWDPVNGTSNPKALPGGKRRETFSVTNPDLVAVDKNTLGLNLPVPTGTMVALDGDGPSSSAFLVFSDGTPTAGVTVTYANPGSTTDDVDFSSDNGLTWAYVPVAGSDTSQAAVTNIRIKPKGTMSPGSQFSFSVSLKTK